MPVSGWQGIRASGTSGQYLITGTSDSNGLLYDGPDFRRGRNGLFRQLSQAPATTSVYGPDNLGNGAAATGRQLHHGQRSNPGFLFQGTTADLSNSS